MTYKAIIHNIINNEVDHFIKTKSGKFPAIDEKKIRTDTAPDKECVMFSVEDVRVRQGITYNSYRVYGYVSEYGKVVVCYVTFERTYCDDNFENEHTKHFFIHGEDLKTFKFDK